jgi:hypothetical protein
VESALFVEVEDSDTPDVIDALPSVAVESVREVTESVSVAVELGSVAVV